LRIFASRSRLLVAALLVLALAIRVWEVQSTSYQPRNDAVSYLTLASQIAHTGDYSNSHAPGSGAGDSKGPSAYFPPAFPYLLAAVDVIDGHKTPTGPAVHAARLAGAVLGTVTVALVGAVALEAFGSGVALIALAIAAIYPVFVELSGTIYAENLLIPLELGAVWAALRMGRSEHPYRWVALAGFLCGLAMLSHLNAIVVLVVLVAAVWRTRWAPVLLVAVAVLTVAPWTIRNAVVLHSFLPVSDETGTTLAGTYNPTSASNRQVPYKWTYYGNVPADAGLYAERGRLTEPQLDSKLRDAALRYIKHHPSAPLAAAYHNTRRLLELDGSLAWRASAYDIGVSTTTADAGVASFWLLLLLAIAGAFTGLARRAPRWLWFIPALLFLSVVFVNGETPRFRAPLDPFLIMASACAVMVVVTRLVPRAWAVLGEAPVRGHQLGPRSAAPPRDELVEVVEGGSRSERDAGQR
jgi:4-amino-4-deoxy-L-arabinose transferase-like glycosyltransferase